MRLLDVNVLIALVWPCHVHHGLVRDWFYAIKEEGWRTCADTEIGFIRLSSNPKIIEDAVSPFTAYNLLLELKKVGSHMFVGTELDQGFSIKLPLEMMAGHRQVTDFHLVSVAIASKGVLSTLDRALVQTFKNRKNICKHLELITLK